MENVAKKQQAVVAANLESLLGQQFRILQQEISGKLEHLQDLAVRSVETSFKTSSVGNEEIYSRWARNPVEKEATTVSDFNDEVMPMRPAMVPRPLPQSMPEELQILEVGDVSLPCQIQKTTPLSIVPIATAPAEDKFSPAISHLSVTPPPLQSGDCSCNSDQIKPRGSHGSHNSDLPEVKAPNRGMQNRQSRRASRRISQAVHDWKSNVRESTRLTKDLGLIDEHKGESTAFVHFLRSTALFGDHSSTLKMKDSIRGEILNPSRQISEKYREEALATKIATSEWFEIVTSLVILFNALWLAVDLDMNDSATIINASAIFIVMENFFCLYFSVELIIRFCAFTRKIDCLSEGWFVFDTFLVLLMIIEVWVMSFLFWILEKDHKEIGNYGNASVLRLFRIVRLSKISRLAKVLHALPELVTLVRGIKFAARTVFFCLCLVICVIYVSALVFRELTYGLPIGEKYFHSVPASMVTLLFKGTMPDQEDFIQDVSVGQIIVGILIVFFIFLTTFTLMNMIVGVLVAVVGEIAEAEKERRIVAFVKNQLHSVFSSPEIDLDYNQKISEDEFESFLSHPMSIRVLTSVGVDVMGLVDVSEFVFKMDGDGGLSFSELLDLVLNFRGSNSATVKDIVDLRMFLTSELGELEEKIRQIFEQR